MTVFFYINDELVNFGDPWSLVKDEYRSTFARTDLASYIFSEICTLDMIFAVADMNGGYYRERLVLKGGLSVRNHVPLLTHRFSFDADYDANTQGGYTYGDVDEIKKDLVRYGAQRRCETGLKKMKDDANFYFLEVGYHKTLGEMDCRLKEVPKVELCKNCRVFLPPRRAPMRTFIDLELLGIRPPEIYHAALEEQLATKLYIIGSSGRQRNHFDAYDAMRLKENNDSIDWALTRRIFEERVARHKKKTRAYVEECKNQLDAMLRNSGKRSNLEETVFQKGFNFDRMVEEVRSMYDFRAAR